MDLTQHPDDRWARAQLLVDHNRHPSRTADDCHIFRAWKYLRAMRRNVGTAKLRADFPDIWEAWTLHEQTSGARWIIEAAIVGKATNAKIAEFLGFPITTIDAYERYFFDVRANMGKLGWFLTCVVDTTINRKLVSADCDYMWKAIAYCAGFDVFIEYIQPGIASPKTMQFLQDCATTQRAKNVYKAEHVVVPNQHNAHKIVENWTNIRKIEVDAGNDGAKDAMTQGLAQVFEAMKLALMSKTGLTEDEPRAAALMNMPIRALPAPAAIPEPVKKD